MRRSALNLTELSAEANEISRAFSSAWALRTSCSIISRCLARILVDSAGETAFVGRGRVGGAFLTGLLFFWGSSLAAEYSSASDLIASLNLARCSDTSTNGSTRVMPRCFGGALVDLVDLVDLISLLTSLVSSADCSEKARILLRSDVDSFGECGTVSFAGNRDRLTCTLVGEVRPRDSCVFTSSGLSRFLRA